MDTSKTTYTRYREFLLSQIMEVDTLFKLYIHIYNKQVDMVEVLNVAPAFFSLVIKAFLENSMTHLSKLYDSNSATVTVYKFLNFIQSNINQLEFLVSDKEIQAVIKSLNEKLHSFNLNISKLKILRDSFLAHNDKEYIFNDDPWEKVGLTIGEINELINLPSEIINEIGVAKGENHVYPEALNALDVDMVFQIIFEYLERLNAT